MADCKVDIRFQALIYLENWTSLPLQVSLVSFTVNFIMGLDGFSRLVLNWER